MATGPAGSRFGHSVASAGDVNGDGYADVVVGAPDSSTILARGGEANVYLGSISGLSPVPNWVVYGVRDGAELGIAVASAGDVDGDGLSDLIVGELGGAFVFRGSPAVLETSPAWTATGDAGFGSSAASAGDLNGDGYSDIVVGDGDGNRAFVYLGSSAGPEAAASTVLTGASGRFGSSVATAGDVNGDGYSDVLVGASEFTNGEDEEGAAYVFHGNASGVPLTVQQRRTDDSAPIGPGLWSDRTDSFRLAALGRTPFGSGNVRLQWEVKPRGTSFDGTGLGEGSQWSSTGVSGVALNELVSALPSGTAYHWRLRLRYDPATTPFAPFSRWISGPWNGALETDLRTPPDADIALTQIDLADPVTTTQTITYRLTVTNNGPDRIPISLRDVIPAESSLVASTPSQGQCDEAGGVVECQFGLIANGATASVDIEVATSTPGTYMNSASIFGRYIESSPGDESSTESTTVILPTLGGRVWDDRDGDGLQGANEPGLGGFVVLLLDDATGAAVDQRVTLGDGSYSFGGLDGTYRIFVSGVADEWALTGDNAGVDDTVDSDMDPLSGETIAIGPVFTPQDATQWDAGMRRLGPCPVPENPVYITGMRPFGQGLPFTILDFQDPNDEAAVTGYNIYRASNPSLPKSQWRLLATNQQDELAEPDIQWIDPNIDASPTGIWYYEIAPFNANCNAEGPR